MHNEPVPYYLELGHDGLYCSCGSVAVLISTRTLWACAANRDHGARNVADVLAQTEAAAAQFQMAAAEMLRRVPCLR